MTYARHQEEVARALRDLLRNPEPLPTETVGVVLACRDQAIKALQERLVYLAGGPEHSTHRPSTMASLAHRPLQHLSQLVDMLPVPPVSDVPPSRLLPGPNAAAATTTADRWRCVARNLLLGTAELTRADHQPWTQKPEAGWHLVGDTASTVEALLEAGSERARMTQRLVAAHAAKLAHWFGTDHTADLATSGVRHELGLAGSPPVTMVRQAADYATAQRTLTALLHGHASLIRPGSDQRPGLTAARALATGQIRLAQTFADWADEVADRALGNQFRSRVAAYRALHVSTTRLVEVEKRRSPLLLTQQPEMVIRLRYPFPKPLLVRELHDLNNATHEFTATVGRRLRQEALGARNILALDTQEIGLPKPQPMTTDGGQSKIPVGGHVTSLSADS